MTDILVTDAMGVPKEGRASSKERFKVQDEQVASAIPEPKGYQILIALPEIEEKTEGGIFKPQETMQYEKTASVVGLVMRMGSDCYKDEKRFPTGPYCEEGDWVIFHAYSGTRISVFGKEFRLINDDTVKAVVRDPRGIMRAG